MSLELPLWVNNPAVSFFIGALLMHLCYVILDHNRYQAVEAPTNVTEENPVRQTAEAESNEASTKEEHANENKIHNIAPKQDGTPDSPAKFEGESVMKGNFVPIENDQYELIQIQEIMMQSMTSYNDESFDDCNTQLTTTAAAAAAQPEKDEKSVHSLTHENNSFKEREVEDCTKQSNSTGNKLEKASADSSTDQTETEVSSWFRRSVSLPELTVDIKEEVEEEETDQRLHGVAKDTSIEEEEESDRVNSLTNDNKSRPSNIVKDFEFNHHVDYIRSSTAVAVKGTKDSDKTNVHQQEGQQHSSTTRTLKERAVHKLKKRRKSVLEQIAAYTTFPTDDGESGPVRRRTSSIELRDAGDVFPTPPATPSTSPSKTSNKQHSSVVRISHPTLTTTRHDHHDDQQKYNKESTGGKRRRHHHLLRTSKSSDDLHQVHSHWKITPKKEKDFKKFAVDEADGKDGATSTSADDQVCCDEGSAVLPSLHYIQEIPHKTATLHLLVLVHGIKGFATDLSYLKSQLEKESRQRTLERQFYEEEEDEVEDQQQHATNDSLQRQPHVGLQSDSTHGNKDCFDANDGMPNKDEESESSDGLKPFREKDEIEDESDDDSDVSELSVPESAVLQQPNLDKKRSNSLLALRSSEWSSSARKMKAKSKKLEWFAIHAATCNENKTDDGVANGGERLTQEIYDIVQKEIESIEQQQSNISSSPVKVGHVTLSLVGNSLGGLYSRYAAAKVMDFATQESMYLAKKQEREKEQGKGIVTDDTQKVIPGHSTTINTTTTATGKDDTTEVPAKPAMTIYGRRLSFNVFCTTASPHLGIADHTYIKVPRSVEVAGAYALFGDTGRDIFRLTDLLWDMCTSPYYLNALATFQRRIAFANAYSTDFAVPTETAAFLHRKSLSLHTFVDFGLDHGLNSHPSHFHQESPLRSKDSYENEEDVLNDHCESIASDHFPSLLQDFQTKEPSHRGDNHDDDIMNDIRFYRDNSLIVAALRTKQTYQITLGASAPTKKSRKHSSEGTPGKQSSSLRALSMGEVDMRNIASEAIEQNMSQTVNNKTDERSPSSIAVKDRTTTAPQQGGFSSSYFLQEEVDELVKMSTMLDTLGWKKVFVDMREALPSISLPKLSKFVSVDSILSKAAASVPSTKLSLEVPIIAKGDEMVPAGGSLSSTSAKVTIANDAATLAAATVTTVGAVVEQVVSLPTTLTSTLVSTVAPSPSAYGNTSKKNTGASSSSATKGEPSRTLTCRNLEELRRKRTVPSKDLADVLSAKDKIGLPLGHNMMVAHYKPKGSNTMNHVNQRGRPVMDSLAQELVEYILG